MNRKPLSLIAVIIYLSCKSITNEIQRDNDLKSENLLGEVKEIEIVYYTAEDKFGKITKGQISPGSDIRKLKFNMEGNLTDEYITNSAGKITEHKTYEYKNKLKQMETTYDGLSRIITKHIFIYDDSKKLKEKGFYYSDSSLSKKTFFEYNKDGKIKNEMTYMSNGNPESSITYTYLENIIEIKSEYFIISHTSTKTVIHTDQFGNQTEISYYENEYTHPQTNKMQYDDKNNLIEEELVEESNIKTITKKYNYQYDVHNNWIARQYYEKGVIPKILVERTIKYY